MCFDERCVAEAVGVLVRGYKHACDDSDAAAIPAKERCTRQTRVFFRLGFRLRYFGGYKSGYMATDIEQTMLLSAIHQLQLLNRLQFAEILTQWVASSHLFSSHIFLRGDTTYRTEGVIPLRCLRLSTDRPLKQPSSGVDVCFPKTATVAAASLTETILPRLPTE